MTAAERIPGADAIAAKGWWAAHRWLVARRITQIGILLLFVAGPVAGIWILKGNLNSSVVLDAVPLTDPFVMLQSLAAGRLPELTALSGALIVAVVIALFIGMDIATYLFLASMDMRQSLPAFKGDDADMERLLAMHEGDADCLRCANCESNPSVHRSARC